MEKKERATLDKMLTWLVWFQRIWLSLIITLIVLSLFALFLISFIYDKDTTLNTMNGWASLILGLVATILSIISTIVSFYNLERTNEINEDNIKTMESLNVSINNTFTSNKETVRTLELLKRDLEKFADDIPKKTAKEIEGTLKNNPTYKEIDEEDLPF